MNTQILHDQTLQNQETHNPALDAIAPFCLFGMGHRRKLLYRAGALRDARTGETIGAWDAGAECFEPAEYRVRLDTPGGTVRISEDEHGVWLEESGKRCCLTSFPVLLPRFDGHAHAGVLRALHQEILVNVTEAGPLPNFFVYDRPWFRDAALMLMCLARTGNLPLVQDWVRGLRDPFDRNNGGQEEPDNLGQVLYMISLAGGADHPLVPEILAAVPRFLSGRSLTGLTDYGEHPVYQTKWLKYGLRSLGLDDPYEIPAVRDSYSALFWMGFREAHVDGPCFSPETLRDYPYLNWAEAHFYGDRWPAPALTPGRPLSWETRASEANYHGLTPLLPELADRKCAAPHTWHAAEMFLYLTPDTKER